MNSNLTNKIINYGFVGKSLIKSFILNNTKPIPKHRNWLEVIRPAAFIVNLEDGHQLQIVINSGVSNLASIPRPFRWLIKPDDKYLQVAAIVHDILVNEIPDKNHSLSRRSFTITRPNNTDIYYDETKEISASLCDSIFKHIIIDGVVDTLNPRTALIKGYVCYYAIRLWSLLTLKFTIKPN